MAGQRGLGEFGLVVVAMDRDVVLAQHRLNTLQGCQDGARLAAVLVIKFCELVFVHRFRLPQRVQLPIIGW